MKNNAIHSPEWLNKNAIYQINPRTFSKEGTIEAITKELPFLKELGFNIIYLCPIFEEDDSSNINNWSSRQIASKTKNPKNMYRINDYFNVDEEYGVIDDLKEMINKAHELNMKVLLDLVYAHIGPNAPIIKKYPEFVKQTPDGSFICTSWNFPELDFRSEGLREYLYCNMVYYIAVIDVDGFRLDVGDKIPIDFWKEARRRIQAIKKDAILINEGSVYENMVIAFDASYCFAWHDMLRNVYCENRSAAKIRELHEELESKIPFHSKLLRDIDNHDTVTDWEVRTEIVATNKGMEQIEVLNYLIDGIPMVYSGNELACTAQLSMFANRFYMGSYEVTDRENKNSEESMRRQKIIKILNAMKSKSNLLCYGKTVWLDTSAPDSVIAFKRILDEDEILFFGNTQNSNIVIDIKCMANDKKCILYNGKHKIKDNMLHLNSYEYVVFE